MNKLIFITVLFISTITFSQETKNTNKGVFKFESEIINYGKIKQNDNGNRVFKFKNIGNAPIVISSIKGSCGCTVATKPNKPIMPNETAEIEIAYETNRIGGFSKTVTVISNASESRKVLRIKGFVLKPKTIQNTTTTVAIK